LLKLTKFETPLWIRRVLVRAQEGQLERRAARPPFFVCPFRLALGALPRRAQEEQLEARWDDESCRASCSPPACYRFWYRFSRRLPVAQLHWRLDHAEHGLLVGCPTARLVDTTRSYPRTSAASARARERRSSLRAKLADWIVLQTDPICGVRWCHSCLLCVSVSGVSSHAIVAVESRTSLCSTA
jgi:hypothetical protein